MLRQDPAPSAPRAVGLRWGPRWREAGQHYSTLQEGDEGRPREPQTGQSDLSTWETIKIMQGARDI